MRKSAIFTAIAALFLFSASANAQAVAQAMSQQAEVTTQLTFHASNAATVAMSSLSVSKIARSQEIATLAARIPQAASSLSGQIGTQIVEIANGTSKTFTTGVIKVGNVMDQRSITVKVSYEPRPIGGILNVRVDLVPVFAGIGGASRPAATRSEAQAVETVTDQNVQEIVTRLSSQIAVGYQPMYQ